MVIYLTADYKITNAAKEEIVLFKKGARLTAIDRNYITSGTEYVTDCQFVHSNKLDYYFFNKIEQLQINILETFWKNNT